MSIQLYYTPGIAANALAVGTATFCKPLGARYASGQPLEADLRRQFGTNVNSFAQLWGADLPHRYASAGKAQVLRGDGVATVFDTAIPFTAWSNHNLIVLAGTDTAPTLRAWVASGPTGAAYTISNVGGFIRITFATAPSNGHAVLAHAVTPVLMFNLTDTDTTVGAIAGTNSAIKLKSYDVLWGGVDNTGNASGGNGCTITIRPQIFI